MDSRDSSAAARAFRSKQREKRWIQGRWQGRDLICEMRERMRERERERERSFGLREGSNTREREREREREMS